MIKPIEWWLSDYVDGAYEGQTVGGIYLLEPEGGAYQLLEHIYDDHGGTIKGVARGPLEELKALANERHADQVAKFLVDDK